MKKATYKIKETEYSERLYRRGVVLREEHIVDYHAACSIYERFIFESEPAPGCYCVVRMYDKMGILLYQKQIERGSKCNKNFTQ